jgi:hypothetical protein
MEEQESSLASVLEEQEGSLTKDEPKRKRRRDDKGSEILVVAHDDNDGVRVPGVSLSPFVPTGIAAAPPAAMQPNEAPPNALQQHNEAALLLYQQQGQTVTQTLHPNLYMHALLGGYTAGGSSMSPFMSMSPAQLWDPSNPMLMQQAQMLSVPGAVQHQYYQQLQHHHQQLQQQQLQQQLLQQQVPVPTASPAETSESPRITGRPSSILYLSCDADSLSAYQCLVRKQIELFEAVKDDVETNAQGRNRPIVLGQVGIRCHHCSMLPPKQRARGAIYYPSRFQGVYQAAQNLAGGHLLQHCLSIPAELRSELARLREGKSTGGGKKYWADGVKVLGVEENQDCLRFQPINN